MDIEVIIRRDVRVNSGDKIIRILPRGKKAKDILIEEKILRMKKLLMSLKENKKEDMVKNTMTKKKEDVIMEKKEEDIIMRRKKKEEDIIMDKKVEDIIMRKKEKEDIIVIKKVDLTIMKEKDITIIRRMDLISHLSLNNHQIAILLQVLLNCFNQLIQILMVTIIKRPIAILNTQAHLRRNSSIAKVCVWVYQ